MAHDGGSVPRVEGAGDGVNDSEEVKAGRIPAPTPTDTLDTLADDTGALRAQLTATHARAVAADSRATALDAADGTVYSRLRDLGERNYALEARFIALERLVASLETCLSALRRGRGDTSRGSSSAPSESDTSFATVPEDDEREVLTDE